MRNGYIYIIAFISQISAITSEISHVSFYLMIGILKDYIPEWIVYSLDILKGQLESIDLFINLVIMCMAALVVS